ncbi:MAG: helicase-exonuclease AddAB subunit AddA [Paenibacillaceae bacterium]|nr:helicase-exonuclease AddAB subunit AddA [Paenibacillaceae bacterium]
MIDPQRKPEGSTWTDKQWEAIARTGEHVLVAAAAGSGKTAVLVERIIRRIADPTDGVDVDRLLVATFTKAAADEMRERIREALAKELLRQPDSPHLRKQLALMGRAAITTLHSFCLDVVRRHFQAIPIDPRFRIADETEAELLRMETLERLMEENYERSPEGSVFWQLTEWYGGQRSDDALFALVLQLYDASRSHPDPDAWLDGVATRFEGAAAAGAAEDAIAFWTQGLLADVRLALDGAASLLNEALAVANESGGPKPYAETLEDELAMVAYVRGAAEQSWARLHEAGAAISFGRLKPCKGDSYDKALQEQAKELREAAKERLYALREELLGRTPQQFAAELAAMAPLMRELTGLVSEFGRRFLQAKMDKGLVDFADLEHFCLQVLTDRPAYAEADGANASAGESDARQPSFAALAYREQFAEVLLDEYQDTNRVQEAIVALISRDAPGNRFMVGDVKQSIYRFRLAEPGLFLGKYRTYGSDGSGGGRRIDLASNFRSRREVVDGVNFLFRQMMQEDVFEIAYDKGAELVHGAVYYPEAEAAAEGEWAAELLLIDRGAGEGDAPNGADEAAKEEAPASGPSGGDEPELETAQLEARLIASRIRDMAGSTLVFDKKAGGMRPATYRDFVILLRATQMWSPVFVEELRACGIPAYADISSGYFEATEIEVMFALLGVIDNPFQDIPLAAVLRSPLVGLAADELARIRLARKSGSYYAAVLALVRLDEAADAGQAEAAAASALAARAPSGAFIPAAPEPEQRELAAKLRRFLARLDVWRDAARSGSLADLIWRIYGETGYYDFFGGMPGGAQRQANLRSLYDRARQYEATSLRGLFRFLRFVERMRDSGGDLGAARALGEQEDVVRIMSIHKSKGLEFPVVFVAGLAKRFNRRDLDGSFLLHKDLGFGPKVVDTEQRVSYPSLPLLAIKGAMRREMLAEELRVLYVALTRARERLILIGTVNPLQKQLAAWGRHMECGALMLPGHELSQAISYLDWIGPAVIRHPDALPLRRLGGLPEAARLPAAVADDPSRWRFAVVTPAEAAAVSPADSADAQSAFAESAAEANQALDRLHALRQVPQQASEAGRQLAEQLAWKYPLELASRLPAKTSVTELKRLSQWAEAEAESLGDEGGGGAGPPLPALAPQAAQPAWSRPRFVQMKRMTAAERGTVYHAVMQNMPLRPGVNEDDVRQTLAAMREKRLLTQEQHDAVDTGVIAGFFAGALGSRLLRAKRVLRETPFSYGMNAEEAYAETEASIAGETVLVQGVIDCLFEEEDGGLVLLDYKTDATTSRGRPEPNLDDLAARYRLQIGLYTRAVQQIWKRPVTESYVFFFDGAVTIRMGG